MTSEPRVMKRTTPSYSEVYTVNLPVEFYFNFDGTFDGIEVTVAAATEFENNLIGELCDALTPIISHQKRSKHK